MKLRTSTWKQRKFSEFVEFYNGLTYLPDNVYVDSEKVTSENVKDGDIIVVVRNGSRALIGKHAEIKRAEGNRKVF